MPIPADSLDKLEDAELDCLRCGTRNKAVGELRIAEASYPDGNFGQLIGGLLGGLEVEAQICPRCGKLELFS